MADTKKDANTKKSFPVVGIGASAGGLKALKIFFAEVGTDSGVAYIVVVHLSPKQPSVLPEILSRETGVPVNFSKDGETIEPGRVYVAPPDKILNIYKGTIQHMDRLKNEDLLPIDSFFRSLAADQRENSVGIILSGTGADGTIGIKEIKGREGLVLVQSADSAEYTGMPESAIESRVVDRVLAPREMPDFIRRYFSKRESVRLDEKEAAAETDKTWMNKIFSILATKTGHDFSSYKESTIVRRLQRRMAVNQIEDRREYVQLLREETREAEHLFHEFLIGVTRFFRDPESFEVLKNDILPDLIRNMGEDRTLRAWVPGCSSGEEAYSLAIVIRECLEKEPKRLNVQIFGTDIDKRAIDRAREGYFPSSIAADVSRERLAKFFLKEGNFFRIRKEIRESVIFSEQDLVKDPPFSRLNVLCCRNLLIYLNADLQKKLLPLFHYTLTPGGILMLGSSETVGQFSELFQILNNKWKIYQRKEVPLSLRREIEFPTGIPRGEESSLDAERQSKAEKNKNFGTLTKEVILDLVFPTAVLVDGSGSILHVHGRTGKYLESVTGPPSHNIVDLAREGLRIELSGALRKVHSSQEKIVRKDLRVKTNGDIQHINLSVYPLKRPEELAGKYLVVFEDLQTEAAAEGKPGPGEEQFDSKNSHIRELEQELQKTKEDHQATIEELESANEELKSTNEEMQSSNEELQSTNEELESSKEELQSLNEELQTVNSELQSKVEELAEAKDDLQNLLNSVDIASLFVDNNIRIKRFSKEAQSVINLINSDIGRPLEHTVSNLDYDGLIDDIKTVLETLRAVEKEVRGKDGAWYKMRIMPYRTTNNKIDGAVITFVDIDDQKEWELLLMRKVFDMNPDPLAVLDRDFKLVVANRAFSELMELPEQEISGADIFSVKNEALELKEIKKKLEKALSKRENFVSETVTVPSQKGNIRYSINGQIVAQEEGDPYRILLVFKQEE